MHLVHEMFQRSRPSVCMILGASSPLKPLTDDACFLTPRLWPRVPQESLRTTQ